MKHYLSGSLIGNRIPFVLKACRLLGAKKTEFSVFVANKRKERKQGKNLFSDWKGSFFGSVKGGGRGRKGAWGGGWRTRREGKNGKEFLDELKIKDFFLFFIIYFIQGCPDESINRRRKKKLRWRESRRWI